MPSRTLLCIPRPFIVAMLWFALLVPTCAACWILYTQRLPFPYQDDYKSLLNFAWVYHRTPHAAAQFTEVATIQYNEYRLIFQHFVVAAELILTHRISFAFLTALGDSFVLAVAWLFWLSFKASGTDKLVRCIPASLLLFSLSYWETLNWAMAGLQNLPVIFFAFLSLYLLVRGRAAFAIGCVSALLSCCASANGFLLWPVGVVFLLLWRNYARLGWWTAAFLPPLSAYLYHRVTYPTPHHSIASGLFYFAAFFGSVLPWRFAAAPLGLVVLLVFAGSVRARFHRENPVLFFLSVWIVLTGVLAEAVRASIASRYSIYSVMLLICCYAFLLQRHQRRSPAAGSVRWIAAAAVLASLLCTQADIHAYRGLHARREMVLAGLRYYRADPQTHSPQMNPEVDRLFPDETPFELNMLKRAKAAGIYTAPSAGALEQAR